MPKRTDAQGLSDQQRIFCSEYLKDLNGSKAAIRAGYSALTAASQASELLIQPNIQARVAELEADCISAADVSVTGILRELMRLARVDVRDMFNPDGSLKRPSEWTADQGAAVQSFDVVTRNLTSGDGNTDTVLKVRMYDKTRAMEMLAKHLSLLTEKVEHTGTIQIQWLDGPTPVDVHVLPAAALPVLELQAHPVPEVEGVGVGGGGEEPKGE